MYWIQFTACCVWLHKKDNKMKSESRRPGPPRNPFRSCAYVSLHSDALELNELNRVGTGKDLNVCCYVVVWFNDYFFTSSRHSLFNWYHRMLD
jgi:hypothetical protein